MVDIDEAEGNTVKEEIFVGEKIRTFSFKTFRTEFNFVLYEWLTGAKQEEMTERNASRMEENLVWKLISYFFSNIRKLRN